MRVERRQGNIAPYYLTDHPRAHREATYNIQVIMGTVIDNAVVLQPTGVHRCSIVWLHGLGADGSDFVPVAEELALPDRLGVRYIFPHAPVQAVTINAGTRMRAWYDIRHVELDREEDETGIDRSAARVTELLAAEIAAGIPEDRVVLAGFSQGGAIALHAGLRHPGRLAGLLALSSYLPLADRQPRPANGTVPVLMLHGFFDPVIPVALAQKSHRRLEKLGCTVQLRCYSMAHAVCPQELTDVRAWLLEALGEP